MIDFDEILDSARMYRRIIFFALGLVALGLLLWLFRGYPVRREVNDKISEIKQSAKISERRAEDIIKAEKQREEAIKRETVESVNASSDDALPDLLSGLLRDYRRENGR